MRHSKQLAFVVHGARAEREDVRHVLEWVRAKGHRVTVRLTFGPGDAAEAAASAARAGADVVVAAGGDGTVNEVVNGLDGHDTALGILPLGTANDFARQVGIPADVDHAMDVILRRKPVCVDTASLNGRRFLNASTGGIGAAATAETPTESKESLGAIAYAISGVRKFAELEASEARFEGPGFAFAGPFVLFAVGLMRAAGGGTMITPRALPADGLLDLCIVERMSRADLARLMLRLKDGEHLGLPGVHYAQLPGLTVDSDTEIAVNVDGEVSNARRLQYSARPRDLLVHVGHLPGERQR